MLKFDNISELKIFLKFPQKAKIPDNVNNKLWKDN